MVKRNYFSSPSKFELAKEKKEIALKAKGEKTESELRIQFSGKIRKKEYTANESFKLHNEKIKREKRIKKQQEIDKEKLVKFKEKQDNQLVAVVENGILVFKNKNKGV